MPIIMLNPNQAIMAYGTASRYRSKRDQEAEIFQQVAAALTGARSAGPIKRIRALADNRRLWMTLRDLMRDPSNVLPEDLRATILSVCLAVQREMDGEMPDFEFLAKINDSIAAGLAD
jgi:flagellar biosynthesis regulator FlaF